MKKKVMLPCLCLLVVMAAVAYMYKSEFDRGVVVSTLFTGAEQYENFNRMADLFPTTSMTAAATPSEFPEKLGGNLPDSFEYRGRVVEVDAFLAETDTSALLILHNGELVFERYFLSGGRYVHWLSMSVAKSFVSAGVGIAVEEGLIDIQKSITEYVPGLEGSAYDGVVVKDVLQMSSGATWNEDYSDPESDINRLGRLMALGGSADEFVATLEREHEPGTFNRYNSADTQALGMLLSRATGRTMADYLQEKLWHPLGMESDAFWLTDDHGIELAFLGLNATARDYLKLGELFRRKGNWEGQKIIPEAWVTASTTPDAPHIMPGLNDDFPLGYGYQWWIPESTEGEYSAIGVYNQFIYVNPTRDLVIVKLSAFSDYAISLEDSAYREMESLEFFREVGRTVHR